MYFSIPNLSALTASAVEEPWELVKSLDLKPLELEDKAYHKWEASPNTKHRFISAYEGINGRVRVTSATKDNPLYKMYGIIVDYDCTVPDMATAIKQVGNVPAEFKPSWMAMSRTGGIHLMFEFEEPVLIAAHPSHFDKFSLHLKRKLKLDSWFPSMDMVAYGHCYQYYQIGAADWVKIEGADPIPGPMLEHWSLEISDKIQYTSDNAPEIPLKNVIDEREKLFAGRWVGPFELGSRGVRFWDPSADNPTAAIVCKEGMRCFTGPSAFMPWRSIFGASFVDRFEADRVAGLVNHVAYDSRIYWVERGDGSGEWESMSKDDFSQELRVRGFSPTRAGRDTASEVDKAENYIKKNCRIDKAAPFIFHPPGILRWRNERVLNTSRAKCLAPVAPELAPDLLTWADGPKYFPFVHEVMDGMFAPTGEEATPVAIKEGARQLDFLLGWLKYFYVNSYAQKPRPGHTFVIAGPTGKGKSLFIQKILGDLMGGVADASAHLVEGSQWTAGIAESPIMSIEDDTASANPIEHKKFTARVKKYVANSNMVYDEKFRTATQVPWMGRIGISCNLDTASLSLIPGMDTATKDKIMLFKATPLAMTFPTRQEVATIVAKELPFLARLLIDMDYGKGVFSPNLRFGVHPYHHPELFAASLQQGIEGIILEVLTGLVSAAEAKAEPDGPKIWEGTITSMYAQLSVLNPEILRGITPKQLSGVLGTLSKNGYSLTRGSKGKLSTWIVDYDLFKNIEEEDASARY